MHAAVGRWGGGVRGGGIYEAGSKLPVACCRSRLNKRIVPEGPRVGVCVDVWVSL